MNVATGRDGLPAGPAEAEERRCQALNDRDWTTLRELLDERFSYHHWHGKVDDREHWLNHIEDYVGYHTERESIRVDHYGDIAVVVGVLHNTIVRDAKAAPSTSTITAVQIWSQASGAWREAAHYSFKNPR